MAVELIWAWMPKRSLKKQVKKSEETTNEEAAGNDPGINGSSPEINGLNGSSKGRKPSLS